MIPLETGFGERLRTALGINDTLVSQLPPDAQKRLQRQQIRGAIEQNRVFVVGNTFFAPVLSFQAWNMGINALVYIWTAVMLTFSWWLFFNWRKTYQTDGSAADMNRFVAETRVNASIWCTGMVLFYPFVEGDGKTIVSIVMTGSLALGTVGFSQAPRAAFWYLGIQMATLSMVPMVSGLVSGSGVDLMIGCLACAAGFAIFNAVLERSKAQMRAFIALEKLSEKSEVIDLLLKDYEEQGVEWLWQTDRDGCLMFGPPQVLALLDLDRDTQEGVHLVDAIGAHVTSNDEDVLQRLSAAFDERAEFYNVTLPFQSGDKGQPTWIMMRGRPQFDGGEFSGFRGIFADATTTVETQKKIAYLADHDPLTGLANRNVVKRRLSELHPKTDEVSAFLIDLDGFKQVNDSYGHAIGDRLLEVVAKRLKETMSDDDLVARLGGDEFLLLADGTFGGEESHLVDRLLTTLSRPYMIEQYDIVLSASIGKAAFPHDTTVGPTLLIQADLALYEAKQGGRNQCRSFVAQMQTGLQKRLVVTDRLKAAIFADQITPHYQPQYCAQSGALIGFEALARWHDPDLGTVGPDIFIPIAEETGLIHELGERLLRRACRDAVAWAEASSGDPPLLSVNLSPAQVTRGDVIQLVKTVLADTGLPATSLEIEITEGVLIHDMPTTREVLHDLKFLGVKIALDDFGTGYSSLSYIRALPLDRLKIDRAFVADLDDPTARPIVQTIIDLCSTLDLSVIAEGVETQEHVATLKDMRCDVLQGYYFAPAIPAAQALQLVHDQLGDAPRISSVAGQTA